MRAIQKGFTLIELMIVVRSSAFCLFSIPATTTATGRNIRSVLSCERMPHLDTEVYQVPHSALAQQLGPAKSQTSRAGGASKYVAIDSNPYVNARSR